MYRPGRDRKDEFLARAGFRPNQHGRKRFLRYARETKEHLVRKADGGRGLINNYTHACGWCNHGRGTTPVEEHKAAMAKMMELRKHPLYILLLVAPADGQQPK